jgi:hypothetical protein
MDDVAQSPDPRPPTGGIRTVLISDGAVTTASDVVQSVLAYHQRQAAPKPPPQPAPGYRPESLGILFGSGQLAAASAKLAQVDGLVARRAAAQEIPAWPDIATRAAVIPEPQP